MESYVQFYLGLEATRCDKGSLLINRETGGEAISSPKKYAFHDTNLYLDICILFKNAC